MHPSAYNPLTTTHPLSPRFTIFYCGWLAFLFFFFSSSAPTPRQLRITQRDSERRRELPELLQVDSTQAIDARIHPPAREHFPFSSLCFAHPFVRNPPLTNYHSTASLLFFSRLVRRRRCRPTWAQPIAGPRAHVKTIFQ